MVSYDEEGVPLRDQGLFAGGCSFFSPRGFFSFGMIQVIYMCTIQLGVEGKMGILIF